MKKSIIILTVFLTSFITVKAGMNQDTSFYFLNELDVQMQVDTMRKLIITKLWSNPRIAFDYVKKFKTLDAINEEPINMVQYYYWTGMLYEMFGDYKKAIEYDFKALEMARKAKILHLEASALNNIGIVYRMQPEYREKSLFYFHQYLEINRKQGNDKRVFGAYSNLAATFEDLNNNDSAAYYYKLAYDLASKLRNKQLIALSLSNKANLLFAQGDTLGFKENLLKAISINKEEKYIMNLGSAYYKMANFYIDEKNVDSSMYYNQKLDKLAREYEIEKYEVVALQNYAEIFELMGNYTLAYKNIKEYMLLNDSINGKETDEKLGSMQTLYELKLKDKEIENLKISEQLWKQKAMLLLVVGLAMLFISVVIIYFISMKRKKDRLVNYQQQIIDKKENELIRLELEKSQAKEEELKTEIKSKTRQLTTHALNMIQKNKLMQELSSLISQISKKAGDEQKHQLKNILVLIKRSLHLDKDWDLFKMYFEQVSANFFEKLLEINKNLTSNELRLSALIKLNLNIKETAAILSIEPDSVKRARHRLRKKLGITDPKVKLATFLAQM